MRIQTENALPVSFLCKELLVLPAYCLRLLILRKELLFEKFLQQLLYLLSCANISCKKLLIVLHKELIWIQ